MPVTLDTSEVHLLAADLRRGADETYDKAEVIVTKVAYDINASAQHNLDANGSVDTGHLKNSVGVDVNGPHAIIGPTAAYGGFVEKGTEGPYPIPNAFGWGITVMHPGNDPKPYLAPAADLHEPRLIHAIEQLGESILR